MKKKNKKYYWKVVRVVHQGYENYNYNNNTFISAIIDYGKYSLKYKLNEKTKSILPGGIFCFKTRNDARNFQKGTSRWKILKVKPIGKVITNYQFYDWQSLKYDAAIVQSCWNSVPFGTINFPAVIPVEISH